MFAELDLSQINDRTSNDGLLLDGAVLCIEEFQHRVCYIGPDSNTDHNLRLRTMVTTGVFDERPDQ